MAQSSNLIAIWALLLVLGHLVSATSILSQLEKLYFSFNRDSMKGSPEDDKLNLMDKFMLDLIPTFIGQDPANQNGTKWQHKEYALKDESNDDSANLDHKALITRSGFKYEIYDCESDDGYITTLTRVINPLADRSQLREPPVLMEHGGSIDPTIYLVSSSIQHHPEKYPRSQEDGPVTSWNRSLAFVLANNGFDVWLAETRGSTDDNRRRDKTRSFETLDTNSQKNMTIGETINQLFRIWAYNEYSLDDIINHELKSHMDLVMNVTKSPKVHLMTYSLSTPTSLAFISIRPDYARKIQGYVSMAPIISGDGVNSLVKLLFQVICPALPDRTGGLHFTEVLFSKPMREFVGFLTQSKTMRYLFVKGTSNMLLGPSAKWESLLDPTLIGHFLKHLSFRQVKQMCQQTKANKLQKYDYGPIKNKLVYHQAEPPVYNLTDLKIKDWIVVSAANDKLAPLEIVDRMYKIINPKPMAHVVAPGFNHVDLVAGFDNDRYVNLPILAYLTEMSERFLEEQYSREPRARNFDIETYLPENGIVQKHDPLTETQPNYLDRAAAALTSEYYPEKVLKDIQTGVSDMFNW